jgi:sterol desaturase/sphingolipid hydroxylase (fatty acid hydroxylase superfamily)
LFLSATLGASYWLLDTKLPSYLITGAVVGPLAAAAAIVEYLRPERAQYQKLDQPLLTDAAHFLFNYHFGYVLALAGCALLTYVRASVWPAAWPVPLQIALAAFVAEGISYWQHRLSHRVPWLWRFHVLHHSGERLNIVRAGRFHFVDIGAGAFMVLAPLVVLGAPESIIIWTASLSGMLGILSHSNMRMRTPGWLAWLICTPAVHRHHHSRDSKESNRNFGTTVMVFDVLFGTFDPPRPDGPQAMGVHDDPTPRAGFWQQVVAPFRGA